MIIEDRAMTNLSRRTICAGMAAICGASLSTWSFAQSASDINRIIKDLAPLQGQTPSGHVPQRREAIVIESQTVIVDAARHIEMEIYFDYNSDAISPRARDQLRALGEALCSPELSSFRYLIAGHTDGRGSDAFNVDLSTRRARSIFFYLTETYAIDPARLMTVGFGFRRLKTPDMPLAAINRRVEVLLLVS